MKKYEVIRVLDNERFIGLKVGDIVTEVAIQKNKVLVLCRLPKHLYGKGHAGHVFYKINNYKINNYWWFDIGRLKLVDENKGDDLH
jgi:hypothetical protein